MNRFATEPSLLAPSLPRLFFWPVETMLQLQANAFDAFTRLAHCRNLNDAIAIQQHWLSDYVRGFGGTYQAMAGEGAVAARNAVSSAQEAVSSTQETVGRALENSGKRTAEAAAHAMSRDRRRETRETGRGKGARAMARRKPEKSGKQRKSRKRRAA